MWLSHIDVMEYDICKDLYELREIKLANTSLRGHTIETNDIFPFLFRATKLYQAAITVSQRETRKSDNDLFGVIH